MTSLCSIEVEAFRKFAKKAILDLRGLPPGLHRVVGSNDTNERLGSNGGGKSTFFSDAPTWCLYGQTVDNMRTTDVRSWVTKKPPRVALTFADDGVEQTVQRGPRASALEIGGEAVGQTDAEAVVGGLGFEAWRHAVIWGQERPLFFDLEPSKKMQLLSDAMRLERWERRADAASQRAKRLSERHQETMGRLSGLGMAEERAQQALEDARGAQERWAGEHAAQLEELRRGASAERERADQLEERRGEASMAADRAGTAANLLRPDVDGIRGKIEDLQIENGNWRNMKGNVEQQLQEARARLESFAEKNICPSCGQQVSKRDAGKHAKEVQADVDALETQLTEGEVHAAKNRDEIEKLKKRLGKDGLKLGELETILDKTDSELRSLERELGAAQARAGAAEQRLAEAEKETNPHRETVAAVRRQVAEYKTQLREAEELSTKLAASAERAQFWARGFRDIRLQLVDELLDDLGETTAAVLEDLGLGDWELTYATERETKSGTTQRALHVMIRSPDAPDKVRWENYSGGERQRLRLAGALALSEVLLAHAGAHVDFRVLDEPTRGLSPEGVYDLVEMLGTYAKEAGLRIFFIDHMAMDGLAFASTIRVVNEAGGARIESG